MKLAKAIALTSIALEATFVWGSTMEKNDKGYGTNLRKLHEDNGHSQLKKGCVKKVGYKVTPINAGNYGGGAGRWENQDQDDTQEGNGEHVYSNPHFHSSYRPPHSSHGGSYGGTYYKPKTVKKAKDVVVVGDGQIFQGINPASPPQLSCINPLPPSGDSDSVYQQNNISLLRQLVDYEVDECLDLGDDVLFDISKAINGATAFPNAEEYATYVLNLLGEEDPASRINGDTLSTSDLTGVKTAIVFYPNVASYTQAEIDALRDLIKRGGRVIFIGDTAQFASTAVDNINAILTELGSTISLGTATGVVGNNQPGTILPDSDLGVTVSGDLCYFTGAPVLTGADDDVVVAQYSATDSTLNAVVAGDIDH